MNEIQLPKGRRLVGMPHTDIYQSLLEIFEQLSDARQKVRDATDKHGLVSVHPDVLLGMRHRKFIASAARIYPALFIEAYLNFVATMTNLQYRSDFENMSAAKKLRLYVYIQTGKEIGSQYVDFVKQVFKLRDAEVHQKPEEVTVGSEKAKPLHSTSLYPQCTLGTVIVSINKLVQEVHRLVTDAGHKLPVESLVQINFEGRCHWDENAPFRIE